MTRSASRLAALPSGRTETSVKMVRYSPLRYGLLSSSAPDGSEKTSDGVEGSETTDAMSEEMIMPVVVRPRPLKQQIGDEGRQQGAERARPESSATDI